VSCRHDSQSVWPTTVDATIQKALAGAVDPRGTILGIGAPCPVPVDAVIGISVAKSGRTTGVGVQPDRTDEGFRVRGR
jgi:hypothetical protein